MYPVNEASLNTADSIIKRANEIAPNSNFTIIGLEAVKLRCLLAALLEYLDATR